MALLNYLAGRPYADVSNGISAMRQLQSLELPELSQESIAAMISATKAKE